MARGYHDGPIEEGAEVEETVVGDGVDHLAQGVAWWFGELGHAMANQKVPSRGTRELAEGIEEERVDEPTIKEREGCVC